MKKLILLLFIPLVSFGQTYKEVMSISSVDMFKKVVIENGYEFDNTDEEGWVTYGYNIVKDSIMGTDQANGLIIILMTIDSHFHFQDQIYFQHF